MYNVRMYTYKYNCFLLLDYFEISGLNLGKSKFAIMQMGFKHSKLGRQSRLYCGADKQIS